MYRHVYDIKYTYKTIRIQIQKKEALCLPNIVKMLNYVRKT